MKSKTSLILWSLVFSLILNGLVTFLSYHTGPGQEYYSCFTARQEAEKPVKLSNGNMSISIIDYIQPCEYNHIGWPIPITYLEPSWSGPLYSNTLIQLGLLLNNLIWFLALLVILSPVRYLRRRRQNLSSNIVHSSSVKTPAGQGSPRIGK
jgi:hypothetical protein